MSANTSPIFILTPKNTFQAGIGTSANTAMDGTGTVYTIYTAGADGSYIQSVRVKALGTNSSASVMRIFLNNGSSPATPSNNTLIGEVPLIVTSASSSAPQVDIDYVIERAIQANWLINVCFGTAGAAGWS